MVRENIKEKEERRHRSESWHQAVYLVPMAGHPTVSISLILNPDPANYGALHPQLHGQYIRE